MKLSVLCLLSRKHAVIFLFLFQLYSVQQSLSIPKAGIVSTIDLPAVERGIKTRNLANEKPEASDSTFLGEEECNLFNSDERGCNALGRFCQYNVRDGHCFLKQDSDVKANNRLSSQHSFSALSPQEVATTEHKPDFAEETPDEADSLILSLLDVSQGFLPAFSSKNALLKNSKIETSYRSNFDRREGTRAVSPTQLLQMSAQPSSPIRVGINGFGRIGRLFFRLALNRPDIKIRHINCSMSPKYMAYLIKFDSVHGRFKGDIQTTDNSIIVNGNEITISSVRDPKEIPWADSGVDYVCESTGAFCTTSDCMKHIDRENGASKVVISAPAKDSETPTLVMGVNAEKEYNPAMKVVSCASCTTNCLAPIVKVVDDAFGIEEGLMTTVHASTGTQKVVDSSSKKDWRGGRASAVNIIPSSTGAAKAVARCMPTMAGKLTGMAFRVPTIDASVVDLTARLKKSTSYDAIKEAMKEAASTSMKGILDYTEEPLVSQDIVGEPYSSIFDANAGIMLNPQFVKLVAWYDNEYGYANRLIDLLALMSSKDKGSNAKLKSETSDTRQSSTIPA